MKKPTRTMTRRNDPEFMEFFKNHASVDETGHISVKDCYANLGFNIAFKNCPVNVTYANAVWFLTHGELPKPGYHIDHIDDVSMNNRPDNLQEITEAENQAKRRGKKVYRSYGSGKYGHGMSIYYDKRDKHYYVSRNISRGVTGGESRRVPYGRFSSIELAEAKVSALIAGLKS